MSLVDHESILADLRQVRRAGPVRLRELTLSALRCAAAARTPDGSVEGLLRLAVARIDTDTLRTAAEYTLGLAQGTRDWAPSSRRSRAAQVYGVSVERFRKHQELVVLGHVADQIVELADGGAAQDWSGSSHRHVDVRAAGRSVRLTLHVHPVDLLRNVDVVVSPSNTHFGLPEPYKSSVSASLRRAGAVQGVTGDVHDDPVHDALRKWTAQQGTSGRPVLPGTVAATDPGALASQGIRRIYHAAVAVPRAGTNDYDVLPADITRATSRVLAVLADEHDHFTPPLRSVCFPLLGSGRGGLPYEVSLAAMWPAVEAELARGAQWDLHFVVRTPAAAALLERLPTRIRPHRDQSPPGPSC